MLSSTTLSHRDSPNTCADHSGELSTITPAAATPTTAATRIGRVRSGPVTIWPRSARTSRVDSWSRPFAAPLTSPNAPQNTPNRENPAGSRSRAAR